MAVETVGDKLLLGVNTTIIAMGIVFIVLIFLAVLIRIQSKILKTLSSIAEGKETAPSKVYEEAPKVSKQEVIKPVDGGITKGEMTLSGIEEEEHVAVIMAAVSAASDIPVSSLKIKSIKRVDDTWQNSGRVEQVNQRL